MAVDQFDSNSSSVVAQSRIRVCECVHCAATRVSIQLHMSCTRLLMLKELIERQFDFIVIVVDICFHIPFLYLRLAEAQLIQPHTIASFIVYSDKRNTQEDSGGFVFWTVNGIVVLTNTTFATAQQPHKGTV